MNGFRLKQNQTLRASVAHPPLKLTVRALAKKVNRNFFIQDT